MTSPDTTAPAVWPAWQRILFRFCFLYLLLQIAPWQWLASVPGLGWLVVGIAGLHARVVNGANAHLLHVRPTLVELNGSGDTSYAWAQLWTFLLIAAAGTLLWSALDRRRPAYPRGLYWLRTLVRYYVAANALTYGIVKLFGLQMWFPTPSQLATPLGDFLPMRLSWLFIGYSSTYQSFSGLIETIAGLLLLRRNTVTLGLLVATGAFLNVWLINISYDVPVKLHSMHLLLAALFLLALDARRLFDFLVLNRAVPGTTAYEPHYRERWHHWAAAAAKTAMLVRILVLPTLGSLGSYRAVARAANARGPFPSGIYDVRRFVRNGDTVPALVGDSLRWRDVIFDDAAQGSVGSADPRFWHRYGRGYFRFTADTVHHTIGVWKTSTVPRDSTFLFTMRYTVAAPDTVRLWTRAGPDSIYAELVRSKRHFQLAERQFHWLSEYNR
jgi:hypothetical protein